MPANLSAMLRSVLKARQTASSLERRLLQENGANAAHGNREWSSVKASRMSRRRSLKCPRCDRRFARPVHLGRHLSATHGRKKKEAASKDRLEQI